MNYIKKLELFHKTSCISSLSMNEFCKLRENNGIQRGPFSKDTSDCEFIDGQFYTDITELLPIMVNVALAFLKSGVETSSYYFTTINGALLAFNSKGTSDALYYNTKENAWKLCETQPAV